MKLAQSDIKIITNDTFSRRIFLEIADRRLAHRLQGHQGRLRRAGIFNNLAQTTHIDRNNARVTRNNRIGDVAQKPGHIPQRLLHIGRAIAGDVDRSEPRRKDYTARTKEVKDGIAQATARFNVERRTELVGFLLIHGDGVIFGGLL